MWEKKRKLGMINKNWVQMLFKMFFLNNRSARVFKKHSCDTFVFGLKQQSTENTLVKMKTQKI